MSGELLYKKQDLTADDAATDQESPKELDGFDRQIQDPDGFAKSDSDREEPHQEENILQDSQKVTYKKRKTIFSAVQKQELEEIFLTYHYPSRRMCEHLAEKFETSSYSIKIWFKNQRARRKRRNVFPTEMPRHNYFVPPQVSFTSHDCQSLGDYSPFSYYSHYIIPHYFIPQHQDQMGILYPPDSMSTGRNRIMTTMVADDDQRRLSAFSFYKRKV